MTATIYKDIQDTTAPTYKPVDDVLQAIKDCKLQKQIEAIRNTDDVEVKRNLKSKLPSICFVGKFTKRNDAYVETSNGLAILDFDHLQNVEQKKQEFSKLPYVYAAFVSPSGDGLKVLVRVPKQIMRYEGYYRALLSIFPELDPSNRNLSRVCYMSSDSKIYVNTDAIEFTEYKDEEKRKERPIAVDSIKIDDSNLIIKNLFTWWSKKFPMSEGSRNRNIFILASAFNEYGISENDALSFCLQYEQSDFTQGEIKTTLKSAYRKINLHSTKQFSQNESFKEYLPKEISVLNNIEVSESEVEKIYRKSFIDVKKQIEHPPVAISMGTYNVATTSYPNAFGTFGNFSCIVGASKSKKTFLKSMLVAAFIGGDTRCYGSKIATHRKRDMYVIDIDTEQSAWHAQNVFRRVGKITGLDYPFYKPFALRSYSHKERVAFLEYLIYESELKDNIGLFCVDGIADLIADSNDIKESNAVIQKVMKWTDDKQFHFLSVLHSNYGSNKATGHLGSTVLKKAETVCNVEVRDNVSNVSFTFTRGFPIEDFSFTIGSDALPYINGIDLNTTKITNIGTQQPVEETIGIAATDYFKELKKTIFTDNTFDNEPTINFKQTSDEAPF